MYSFENDYSEIAHPKVLKALQKYSTEQNTGYGLDKHCLNVEKQLKRMIKAPKSHVYLLPGGTQTNLTFISSALRPFEAVIAPINGHINVHETGAIEATGHKICTCPTHEGKLTAKDVEMVCLTHTDEHMVKPKLVFISDSTEYGTIYCKKDLQELRNICDKYDLYLYLDGARLPNALVAEGNDITLQDIAELCDAFYLGGTKNGALFGEALVIANPKLNDNFRFMIKQRGGLTAKGFITGIQFEVLLKNNLYLELGNHANEMAQALRTGLSSKGIKFMYNSPTNQIFPIFTNELIERLNNNFNFITMGAVDDKSSFVRLVCSWATPLSAVEEFLKSI